MAKDAVVTCKVDKHKISKHINRRIDEVRLHIISQLSYVGEECVRIARENGSYNDITGNLRSSIGYVILDDGQPVAQGQSQQYSGKQGDGSDGAQAAQALLDKMQGEFPKGVVLIVCAGMKYAAYVENIRHKDVLASAELKMESLVKLLLNGLID